jgi:hypothetical protein
MGIVKPKVYKPKETSIIKLKIFLKQLENGGIKDK